MSGSRVVECLERVAELRGYPKVDHGWITAPEFCSPKRSMPAAFAKGRKLEFHLDRADP